MIKLLFSILSVALIVKIWSHFSHYKSKSNQNDLDYVEFLFSGWLKDPLN